MATARLRTEVLVIGSGAGGAVTAATLAARGYDVLIIEEGPSIDTRAMVTCSPEAIARLYRHGGLTPIFGSPNIAFVEGRCVGGSTEVNSAFWHRLPGECYRRWSDEKRVADLSEKAMEPLFEELERALGVSGLAGATPPPSSQRLRRGIEQMGWRYSEVPRCRTEDPTLSAFAPSGKQSMQRTYLPRALDAGARLLSDCRALRIVLSGSRVEEVIVEPGGTRQRMSIVADTVFVCGGAVQSAALLRRSGVRRNVGDNLCLHPMAKVAAVFDERIDAHLGALPVYQVKEMWPDIAIGGSVFSPGFLAMHLSESWSETESAMRDWRQSALYYTATRGTNRGRIRVVPGCAPEVVVRYSLSALDRHNLSRGLAHLGEILFSAGATRIYPALRSRPSMASIDECRALLDEPAEAGDMGLSTVHAFSSCPMGEDRDQCAVDSFGKVLDVDNLYVNDASLLPDSPGVNPQGTIMAIALRNADRYSENRRLPARRRGAKPAAVVTGAPGWLGTRLLATALEGVGGAPGLTGGHLRALGHSVSAKADAANVEWIRGDLGNVDDLRRLCEGAEGCVLFHAAGVVHPRAGIRELYEVNVEGTRNLLRAAVAAGVRRIVAVSSNSPFGFNRSPNELFDEQSAYAPYMAYGRSKMMMEELLLEASRQGRIETVIIRPPWFYGPHQPPRQSTFFRMVRLGRFPILGDGRQMRSMAYVDNICQALILAARADSANGAAFWIADERPYSILEIVETVGRVLAEECGGSPAGRQLHLPAGVGDIASAVDGWLQRVGVYQQQIHVLGELGHSIACSIAAAKRDLGYSPHVSLAEGMRKSVRWCLANGVTV